MIRIIPLVALSAFLFTSIPGAVYSEPGNGQGFGPPPFVVEDDLQEPFLEMLRDEQIPISIFLVNGIKLQGQILSFDSTVIILRNSVDQMVYKHAISTVIPARNPTP